MKRRKNEGSGGDTAQVPRRERALQSRLFDDEELLAVARPGRLATFPRYLVTLGLYGAWRKRNTSTLTDQRVLLGKGIIRRDERSIPLSNVDDVSVARRGLYSYVDLTIMQRGRPSTQRIGPMPSRSARRFARDILRHR
jgi:hypothetical protein